MGIFQGIVLMGCALIAAAQNPVFNVTFDSTDTIGFSDSAGNIGFNINSEGTLQTETRNSGSAIVLDGKTYYTATNVALSCLSDVDQCNSPAGGDGFTLSMWVKPDVPFTGGNGAQNIIQFGYGVDQEFGLMVQNLRAKFIFHMQSRTAWKQVTCKIPGDIWDRADSNGNPNWLHVSVKKRKHVDAPLFMTFNGIGFRQNDVLFDIENCNLCTVSTKTPNANNQVTQVRRTLTIGAAHNTATGEFERPFNGTIDDVQFYDSNLGIAQIRNIMNS